MERMMHLSRTAAQALMVAAQGLHRRPERTATKADILETIRRMNVLQIDTIHVVARSPYLVLWSRLGDYPPEWLTDLLAGRAVRVLGPRGLLSADRGLRAVPAPHARRRGDGLA